MKSPPLLLISVLFLGLSQAWTQEQEAPETQGPPKPSATTTEAGEAAVRRVRSLGFRLSAKDAPADTPDGDATPPSSPDAAANLPGPMRLGRVEEPVALPPELAETAREAALAVAAGEWEKARDLYLKMVESSPDNALAYANLGVAEHQLGNLLAAAGNLAKSTTLNPHVARNWRTLGLIHYERGDLALAISCLVRAVHEAPGEAETRLILAAAARDYGWPEAAETELRRAVEIDPKLASAHYNLAVTYLDATPPRIELARRHYYAATDLGAAPSPEIEEILEKALEARSQEPE